MSVTSPDTISDLQTPALLVDAARLKRNCDRMEARCRELGIRFRPHLKTAKSIDVARLLPSAFAHGITVSTLKEAEVFARAGVRDILYAVTISPDKLPRAADLVRGGITLRLAADSVAGVEAIIFGANALGVCFHVCLEIDSGDHRSGLLPDSDLVFTLARRLHAENGTTFDGIYTHGGHSYGCRSTDAIKDVAEEERVAVVSVAERLVAAGIPCPIVSVGSTPTLTHARSLTGVTEARAGVFVFQDVYQVGLHVCSFEDVAATVLTTVIGHRPELQTLLVDAGGLALSKDRSTAAFGSQGDAGYGLVAAANSATPLPGLYVASVFQEHGLVRSLDGPIPYDTLPLGARLRILPNHACMTCAQYDRYYLTEGTRVVSVWPRVNEWV
jgi:D-serine deaminase-like pyridoxal phosphate-dependent protein